MCIRTNVIPNEKAEKELCRMFKEDLNVDITPEAMRLFMLHRIKRLSTLVQRICPPSEKCG